MLDTPAPDAALVTEIHARLERLGAVLDAALAEEHARRRVAAVLHERLGQALALSQIKLAAVRGLGATLPLEAHHGIDEVAEVLRGALETSRALMFDLLPPLLHDLGPAAALDWLAEQLAMRHGLHVEMEAAELPALDPEVATALFRVARAILTDIAERGRGGRAALHLFHDGDHVGVEIADVGRAPARPIGDPAPALFALRHEIRACGGALELSVTPTGTTRVRVRVPLAPRPAP